MPYTLDLTKFYKIWFSKNSDQFLGQENQLRLVRLRHLHPQVEISLIYSSQCLSAKAQQELDFFCKKHRITAVDFDGVVKANIKGEQESVLYNIAAAEIDKAIHNQGGNLAAASDMVRLLTPAIDLGIYADFDVELDFRALPPQIEVNAALLMPVKGQITKEDNGKVPMESFQWEFNNEMIGVSRNANNEIHEEAQEKLSAFRHEVIMNYYEPAETVRKVLGQFNKLVYGSVILYLYYINPEMDVFQFRQSIEGLSLSQYFASLPPRQAHIMLKQPYSEALSEVALQEAFGQFVRSFRNANEVFNLSNVDLAIEHLNMLKHRIYIQTVIQVTGPSTLHPLLKEKVTNSEKLAELTRYGICHSVMKGHFSSQASKPIKPSSTVTECFASIGATCDLSWTEIGAEKQARREGEMVMAANTIKHAWEKYRTNVRYPELKSIAKKVKLRRA